MSIIPGGYATSLPPDSDDVIRRIQALERSLAELTATTTTNALLSNSALASPVEPEPIAAIDDDGVVIPSAYGPIVGQSLVVPEGRTRAIVTVMGSIWCLNSTAWGDAVFAVCTVGTGVGAGDSGPVTGSAAVPAGSKVLVPASHATLVTGLTPGGNLVVVMSAYVPGSTWTDPSGWARLVGTVLWLR